MRRSKSADNSITSIGAGDLLVVLFATLTSHDNGHTGC
jgi:hypothetical protein